MRDIAIEETLNEFDENNEQSALDEKSKVSEVKDSETSKPNAEIILEEEVIKQILPNICYNLLIERYLTLILLDVQSRESEQYKLSYNCSSEESYEHMETIKFLREVY